MASYVGFLFVWLATFASVGVFTAKARSNETGNLEAYRKENEISTSKVVVRKSALITQSTTCLSGIGWQSTPVASLWSSPSLAYLSTAAQVSTSVLPSISTSASHTASSSSVVPSASVTHTPLPTVTPTTPTVTPTAPNVTAIPTTASTESPANGTTSMPTTIAPSPTKKGDHSSHISQHELDAQIRYKWVAVTFCLLFAVGFVVMTIMFMRQRKMYHEMEGDGSLSRLI
ncbi:predicted protein [Nematostella vectensis]|uniref:Uncharacterized protein n=1 Tax=Nematostella vectensis TaxID=45351 RepID=A7SHU8_NEMVE|nr:predicted protein [Nematostella vectensis]|eukprot:XP_001628779.1 predicted protein [Nematostella vectensis]